MAIGGTLTKLREREARLLALRIAAKFPRHTATTTQIKERIPDYRAFSPADLAPSPTRNGEVMWQQIIGNVVSHQKSRASLFNQGLAERTQDGIRVTEKGIELLKSKGLYP
jgi:hypothetical protein